MNVNHFPVKEQGMGYRVLADQTDDFDSQPLDERLEASAVAVVCGRAESVEEARELLLMLGLSAETASRYRVQPA